MNTKLLTISLVALLALSPLGTARAASQTEVDHQNLMQSHSQTLSTAQSLAATAKSLRDQKNALILQLNTLLPAGTNKAWDALFKVYNQAALNTLSGNYTQNSSNQAAYLQQLKTLTPSVVNSMAVQNQVAAILNQLQTLKAQEDALATSLANYQTTLQNLNSQEISNNGKRGK
jgi:hypothetical protein